MRIREVLFVLLLGLGGTPVVAAPSPTVVTAQVTTPVLADGFSIGKLFSGINSRTRMVQACVVFMCIALFIIMRKLC